MLVAALEVHVRRPGQVRVAREYGLVAGARIEPDVENVALALECGAAAARTGEARGQEFLDGPLVPRVRAVLLENVCGLVDQGTSEDGFSTRRAVDRRNRDPPGALARDTPIRPVRHHVEDAVVPPGGDPPHLIV